MQRSNELFLRDIVDAAAEIQEFLAKSTLEQYKNDKLLRAAVERKFMIIGEALSPIRKANPELAKSIPSSDAIIGFRSILVHGYAVVDDERVWRAAVGQLLGLKIFVEQKLEASGGSR